MQFGELTVKNQQAGVIHFSYVLLLFLKNVKEVLTFKFLKRMLGVRRQTPSMAVYGDTAQFPIIVVQ